MQLVEDGVLDLDADINTYLTDFQVVHPQFPGSPITTRQLLTHSSGIAHDDYGVLQLNIALNDADVQPLGEMLEALLTPEGDRYDDAYNWSDAAPGTAWAYSSLGMSLAGFVAESISGTGFDELTQASIFDPLGMSNTSWRLSPYDDLRDELAVMYLYLKAEDTYDWIDAFTFADYPAGSIRSSVNELSRFLAAMINRGSYRGERILGSATADAMAEVQYPDVNSGQAIGWSYWFGARTLLGHGGDDSGASTDMRYDVDTGKGVILLMNVTRRPDTDEIMDRLLDESDGCE
jgi:CubicO group peptidase (beta-lactamase class C family)